MKTTFKILFALVLFGTLTFAQEPPPPPDPPMARGKEQPPAKEKVEAMKIAFITERLNLSPGEAQSFWPIYNAYQSDLEKLRKNRRENAKEIRDMSDKELEKLVDDEIAFRQNELELIKKYHPQLKKVLPVKKVALLYRSEEDFKRKLLEMMRERRENRMNRFR